MNTDLSYEVAEVRALVDTIWMIEDNQEIFDRSYPYLIRILQQKAEELEEKYTKQFT